jgi:hypothetical protein
MGEKSDSVTPNNSVALEEVTVPRFSCSRNNEHYALICTTSLFYILAPTCFGSSLPSSGSFLDTSELLEIQIECTSSNSEGSKKIPDDSRLLTKHLGANI